MSICLLVIVSTGTCTIRLLFSSISSVFDFSSTELADDVLLPLFYEFARFFFSNLLLLYFIFLGIFGKDFSSI
jgi:hypothetical protein